MPRLISPSHFSRRFSHFLQNTWRIEGGIPLSLPGTPSPSSKHPQPCKRGRFAACVLRDVYCSACAERHTLCYPDQDVVYSTREYEYDCPTTKRSVRLPKDAWSEQENACPPGAVTLRQVKT
jgi:hypothetical protein